MLDMTMEPSRTGRPERRDDDALMTGLRVVLADDDGVLFVPLAAAADVFTLAETIRDTEARQAERMRGGVSLRNQVQFDTYLAERQKTPSLTFRDHLREVGGAIGA